MTYEYGIFNMKYEIWNMINVVGLKTWKMNMVDEIKSEYEKV